MRAYVIGGPKLARVTILLIIIPIFFPYLGPFTAFDLQPFYLLSVLLLFFVYHQTLKLSLKGVIFCALLSVIFMLRSLFYEDGVSFRYPFNFIVAIVVGYIFLSLRKVLLQSLSVSLVCLVAGIYILFAMVQLFIDPYFMANMVSRSDQAIQLLVDSGRGVRSISPEPAQFGRILMQLNLLLLVVMTLKDFQHSRPLITAIVLSLSLLLASLLFARSLYSAFVHMLIVATFVLVAPVRYKVAGFIAVAALWLSVIIWIQDARLAQLFWGIIEDPSVVFQSGASRRLFNIPISIVGGIFTGPFGFDPTGASRVISIGFGEVQHPFSITGRNHGGWVEFFYIFGVLALPLYLVVFSLLKRVLRIKLSSCEGSMNIGLVLVVGMFVGAFAYGPVLDPLNFLIFACAYELAKRKTAWNVR